MFMIYICCKNVKMIMNNVAVNFCFVRLNYGSGSQPFQSCGTLEMKNKNSCEAPIIKCWKFVLK
jgi:hypothetical protein